MEDEKERKDTFYNLTEILKKTGIFLEENGACMMDKDIHIERIIDDRYSDRLQATVTIAVYG